MAICFPYLGEFQSTKYREKILCWMEVFWTLGIIILPLIAWLIIPLQINFLLFGIIHFRSWNLFVALCAIPSILIAIWLFFFPESPKFLIEVGDVDEALDILRDIYHMNTGRSKSDYPIKSLKEKEREKNSLNQPVPSLRALNLRKPKHLNILLKEIWEQTKALCKSPHLKNTTLTCAIQFGLTASYYTLMIWFPELFHRFEEYEKHHGESEASVCIVSNIVLNENDKFCGDPINDDVFWHTVIIGLSCIPTSLLLPACIHRVGAKLFICTYLLINLF